MRARTQDAELRRAWRSRIIDTMATHGGGSSHPAQHPGGIEKWWRLVEAYRFIARAAIQPGRFAGGALRSRRVHPDSSRSKSLLEAVASSLTELCSRDLIALRMDSLRQHYPWLVPGLAYFEGRMTQAPADAAFALRWATNTRKHAPSRNWFATRCAPSATFCGPSSTLCFSPTSSRAGRPAFRPANLAREGPSK